jgi:hypothetical protein
MPSAWSTALKPVRGHGPGMSLDDLGEDIESEYAAMGDSVSASLDRETRNELALLAAAYEPDDLDELVRRGVHMLFQTAVETGNLDFHLRSAYDVTYDEYLFAQSNNTYNQRGGGGDPDDRRYQF